MNINKRFEGCLSVVAVWLPVLIVFYMCAATTVPGSQAELAQHWAFFIMPFLLIPAMFQFQRTRLFCGKIFHLLLCFVLIVLPLVIQQDFRHYEAIRPIEVQKGRLRYIDIGKVWPRFQLRNGYYYRYQYNGITYKNVPHDLFRVDASNCHGHVDIYVNPNNPNHFVVYKEAYFGPWRRFCIIFGGCLFFTSVFWMLQRKI